MQNEFRLVGYPRSGQHAIIHWFFMQMNGVCLHKNNYSHARHMPVWFENGAKLGQKKPHGAIKLTSIGLEGRQDNPLESHLKSIYVVRDVRNHYASLIKHKYTSEANFLPVWKGYAQCALNPPSNSVVVLFDKWASDVIYRRRLFYRICALLDIEDAIFTDAGRDFVPGAGGGSSFVGTTKRGRDMKVLERYKQVALPSIPQELLDMNEMIFSEGNTQETHC